MTQEQLRIQMLAGIITESEYKNQLSQIENYLNKLNPNILYALADHLLSDNHAWMALKHRLNKDDIVEWVLAYVKDNEIELNDLKSIPFKN